MEKAMRCGCWGCVTPQTRGPASSGPKARGAPDRLEAYAASPPPQPPRADVRRIPRHTLSASRRAVPQTVGLVPARSPPRLHSPPPPPPAAQVSAGAASPPPPPPPLRPHQRKPRSPSCSRERQATVRSRVSRLPVARLHEGPGSFAPPPPLSKYRET